MVVHILQVWLLSYTYIVLYDSIIGAQVAAPPQPAGVLRQKNQQQQHQQQRYKTNEKLRAIKGARYLVDQAVNRFDDLYRACKRPPTAAVHESTQ